MATNNITCPDKACGGAMIKKIILIFIVALAGATYFVQNKQWVHDRIAKKIHPILEQFCNCSVQSTVYSVNLFVPSVTLKNVQAYPAGLGVAVDKPQWQWHAQHLTISCSWLNILLSGMFGLNIQVDDLESESAVTQGNAAIIQEHVLGMITGPAYDVPVYLKSLSFKHAKTQLKDTHAAIDIALYWSSESKKIDDMLKSNVHMHDGAVAFAGKELVHKIRGDIHADVTGNQHGYKTSAQVQVSVDVPQLYSMQKSCFVTGNWQNDHGTFSIKNSDQSIVVDNLQVQQRADDFAFTAQAQTPIQQVLYVVDPTITMPLNSTCKLSIQGAISKQGFSVQGDCVLDAGMYNATKVWDAVALSFTKKDQLWYGGFSLRHDTIFDIGGTWEWQADTGKGHVQASNTKAFTVPSLIGWRVDAQKCQVVLDVDKQQKITGSYTCLADNALLGNAIELHGKLFKDEQLLVLAGALNNNPYELSLFLKPRFRLKRLTHTGADGKQLIAIDGDGWHTNSFTGLIQFPLLRAIINYVLDYDVQGEGAFKLKGALDEQSLSLQTSLDHGTIRLPQTYNFINDFHSDFMVTFADKKVTLRRFDCALQRGNVVCEQAYATFDNDYKLLQAYMPLTINSCLLNLNKDLFAMFSGALTLTKIENALPLIKGRLVLEQAQLNENLFSDKFQKELFNVASSMVTTKHTADAFCDITLETKNPIHVETAFLATRAKFAVHVTNTIRDPKLAGSLELLSGTLEFPYKPLNITKGSISFVPHQLYDPAIELIAKNKIKKYNVTLQVTGSLLNHHISLESSPPLSEEQIIALLLAGSAEQSLSIVMPALIMQNLKTLIFDADQSPLKLSNYFKGLLKPLQNIHLVPSFIDQTGRGGLRGAIEIDVNDRLRAMAQKNFSLSEDTRFELEYLLSDDVTIRGIRDERRDVGGEVEMRWKFGS